MITKTYLYIAHLAFAMGSPKLSQAEFTARAERQHGAQYDYSQANYIGAFKKVTILCAVHGPFEQTPASHLYGRGCRKCSMKNVATANQAAFTGSQEDFLKRGRARHGEKYDYSQVEYIGSAEKVTIICREHGAFSQQAAKHCAGSGCPSCGKARIGKTHIVDTPGFVTRARAQHGDKYDYSQSICRGGRHKIAILCPVHGRFEQRASSHLEGVGCPSCGRELADRLARLTWLEKAGNRTAYLYFVRLFNANESFYKVGVTVDPIEKRFHPSNTNGYQHELLALHKSTNAKAVYEWEQSMLETFSNLRYRPLRPFVGQTECVSSADEILACFPL